MRLFDGAGSPFRFTATLTTFISIIPWSQATPLVALAEAPDPPCSATSNRTGTFVDLHSLMRKTGDHYNSDYTVRGYDYNTNFTLNICAPVISAEGHDFHALPESANVSAYYQRGDVTYSLGRTSTQPKFRGRKLVMEYTGGSLCPQLDSDGLPIPGKDNTDGFKKSTLLSFTCDREMVGPATISFVGMLNECSYFFDVRTPSACATVKQQPLGPITIFGIILLVALLVYFVGGCFYQRTVLHARGWRQIPHWQTWLGALNFIWDALRLCLFAGFNMCRRLCGRGPTGRFGGYTAGSGDGRFGRRSSGGRPDEWPDVDDENRLIDQLDDDWSDG